MKILLSIHPKYVDEIIKGNKKYEFRKVRCRLEVKQIVIYVTSPKKKIIGEVKIENVIEDEVNEVWKKTKDYAGISYKFFKEYYKGRTKAIAYKLSEIEIYEKPKELLEYGIKKAPQSFVYLKSKC